MLVKPQFPFCLLLFYVQVLINGLPTVKPHSRIYVSACVSSTSSQPVDIHLPEYHTFSLTTSPFKYFDVLYPPRTLCSSVSSFTMWPLPLLFLLHILDFLNHPADHHLVWPDTTLKSPIHFQTAPSASAYHVFNLYSRPPPTHTHSHAVKCVQNPKPTYFLSLSSHLPNTSLSPRFPSHMSTEIWSSHHTLFHFIQLTAEFLGTALIFAAALAKNIICTTA